MDLLLCMLMECVSRELVLTVWQKLASDWAVNSKKMLAVAFALAKKFLSSKWRDIVTRPVATLEDICNISGLLRGLMTGVTRNQKHVTE